MKKLYTLGMALGLVAFGTQSFAQVNTQSKSSDLNYATAKTKPAKKAAQTAKDESDEIIFWSEDFSNGLAGMGTNGAWTTGEAQGQLWFKTFPIDAAVDAYNPDDVILGGTDPDYQDKLPNYFNPATTDVVSSPTRDNGVMMLDADRWNSTTTITTEGTLTQNPLASTLTSPSFDLTGASNALLTLYQNLRLCCSGYAASIDLSVDGGSSWIPFDVFGAGPGNAQLNAQYSFNISDILQGTSDLTNCKVRLNWSGTQSHYFWTVDDINIVSLPDNDLAAGESFTNDYFLHENDVFAVDNPYPAADYYAAFEYYDQPEYYNRAFNFGMEVTNAGALTQTGVTVEVTATAPSGAVYTFLSDPMEIEAGVLDTIMLAPVSYADLGSELGQYLFDFQVYQDAVDERPIDNDGDTRQSTFNNEADNGGYAIMRNDVGSWANSAYTTLGQDVIWATTYVFPELAADTMPKYITHVETVFLFSEGFAETIAGELVYFNVRLGHPFDGEEDVTTVFFGSNDLEYDDIELEFEITEADIWYEDSGEPFNWVSFELPTPILIEPGAIYNAEYRIPAGSAEGIVFPPITSDSEQFTSALYDFADGAWFSLGSAANNTSNGMPIRFRTGSIPTGIEKISIENGLTLVQNYPNPMVNMTKIQYSVNETADVKLEVRDIAGKLVFNKDMGTVPANMPQTYELQRGNLAPGMYTYTIATSEFQVSRKLTVQ